MMDYETLYSEIHRLVGSLVECAPLKDWSDCVHLLDHGEAQEAMDLLIAIAVRSNVRVTRSQQDKVRELMGEFTLTEEGRRTWRYLGDPEMIDRMTVVDGPAS